MKISECAAMLPLGNGMMRPVILFDEQSVVLVDAGIPGQLSAIEEALKPYDLCAKRITHIILTHQDLDHIGSLNEVRTAAPKAVVMAHQDEAPYIDGSKTPAKIFAQEQNPNLSAEDRQRLAERKAGAAKAASPIHVTLADGAFLPLVGGIDVIHTPGHTPGHICLFLRKEGLLVVGDALNINEGNLSGPNPVHTLDMAQATASLAKLLPYNAKKVATYHGGLFDGDVNAAITTLLNI